MTQKIKRGLAVAVLAVLLGTSAASLALFHDRAAGIVARPFAELALIYLFGLPVSFRDLRIDVPAGTVSASGVRFMNPAGFPRHPHLDIRHMKFDIDFAALRRKDIRIREVLLEGVVYRIDRMATPAGPRNSVTTWWRYMKAVRSRGRKPAPPVPPKPGPKWHLLIERFTLLDATFIYDDRSPKGSPKRFVFQHFNGFLTRLECPVPKPVKLTQDVDVRGIFGEAGPTPFWIRGTANFPTSDVSFRLEGEIEDGLLTEQRNLWEGLPIEIKEGTFRLKSMTLCDRKQIRSQNRLHLKAVKAVPGKAPADMIWGVPMAAFLSFMQEQKVVALNVDVHGRISDPKFEFAKAFREAFQKALRDRSAAALKILTHVPTKIAAQTGAIVVEAPGRIVRNGLEKITGKPSPQDEGRP